jgi:hypothetical protein
MSATAPPRPFFTAASSAGIAALVVANLVVGVQAVLHGWGYYQTLLVYWFEALTIGGYNLLRLLVTGLCSKRPFGSLDDPAVSVSPGARVFFTLLGTGFFAMTFGAFALAIGFLVVALPAWATHGETDNFVQVVAALHAVGAGVLISVAVLIASHGFSFVRNFLIGGEYKTRSVLGLIVWPYSRMGFVACVLAVGVVIAWLLPDAQGAAAFVVLMVLAKTAADLAAHVIEHRPRHLPPPANAGSSSGMLGAQARSS